MKQYRLQPGTSSRIYYLLTVKDDGTMTLEFHGTDRTLTEEAGVNQDGWIVTKGAMYPPIDHPNGRWQLMDDVRGLTEEVQPAVVIESETDCNMIQTRTEVRTAHESFDTENRSCATQGRPSPTTRQRRRRAVAVETPAAQAVALEKDGGNSQLMKALGIAVASIAALVIIYNTGLLIPMGLIGLGASGLLK